MNSVAMSGYFGYVGTTKTFIRFDDDHKLWQ